MKQKSQRARKSAHPRPKAPKAAHDARGARLQRVQITLGYLIVALSVVGGFLLSFWPQVFGLRTTNPAVGFGLAALAAFRLYTLRLELRRQDTGEASG